jgi:ER-bound oxygenase mpaB/B'/Rubber oxygenase, catalytic domain
LAVIADSGRQMYETLVGPLSEGERDALWQDYVRFGELFGLPRSEVPGSHSEFRIWWDWKFSSPDLHATEHALEMAPLLAFCQPVPAAARANLLVQNHIIKGTLSSRVRELFGIRWSAAHETSFRSIAAAHRRAHRLFPRAMRRGRNDAFFDLVSRAERRRGGPEVPASRILTRLGFRRVNLARALHVTSSALIVIAIGAGCGSSSRTNGQSQSQVQESPRAKISTAPIGAATRPCRSPTAGVEQLRLTGSGCAVGRIVVTEWRRSPACSTPAGASRHSCTVSGYRCLGTATDAGIAVSCAKEGRAISFISKRD